MPNYTTNYKLAKPLATDLYDIEVFNANMDKLDEALNKVKDDIPNSITVDDKVTTTGKNPVSGAAVAAYAQPKVIISKTDLTAGTSKLTSGEVYLVYE